MAGERKRSDDDSASTSLSSADDLHECFPEPHRWKYDVFLSFQGEGPSGTRYNFTDVLYTELCRKGIMTFKDDEELGKGRVIGDDLLKAIEDSALFLVVFSKDYASSKWCLNELVKIIECCKNRGPPSSLLMEAFALPIFHDVEPKDVRKQEGSFKESFLRHDQDDTIDKAKICEWKSAMEYVGSVSGWVTHEKKWTEIIDDITQLIFNRTNHHWSSVSKDLVGLNSHLQNIMTLLNKDSVCFVGIYGIGGIGKTTLANAVHKRIGHCFEVSIFLPNIRETSSKTGGLMCLQKQLISELFNGKSVSLATESDGLELIRKRLSQGKLLIILDDVDDSNQLEALVSGPDWFRKGSKAIITTRNKRVLDVYDAVAYELGPLNEDHALQLFCRKAFHSDSPQEDYMKLSYDFVNRAKGLPLALEVLGLALYKRPILEWQSILSDLEKIPIQKVTSTLRISYDALDENSKEVFLHIACLIKWKLPCRVLYILSSCCDCNLNHIISFLKERLLITESYGSIWMHDLIQEMGREVVRQESPDDPGRRSLLWHWEDIYNVFMHNTGTELVKGIVLTSPLPTFRPLSTKAFLQMTKLRLLILHNISFYDSLDYLSNNLRYLEWQGFPFEYLPTSFNAKDLVELNLPNSHIKELWCGTKYFMCLKTIELSHSKSLSKTPDFTSTPNLEKIILEGCLRLQEVHKSIGILEKLTLLNLKDCEQLEALPDSICDLPSLRILNLSGCSSLIALPQNLGSLKCLEELTVAGANRKRSSASCLSLFIFFAFESSRSYIPNLSGLVSLKRLNLSFCNLSDGKVLDSIGRLHFLEYLNLDGNLFVELSPCFTQLTKLRTVTFVGCKSLRYLPTLPLSVERVHADDCHSLELLPNQLTVPASYYICWEFWNCRNLFGNCGSRDLARMLLEIYLGSPARNGKNILNRFDILIPGNSIPTWISNQRSGHVVSIDLPETGLQGIWNGFVVCCVFGRYEQQNVGMDDNGSVDYIKCIYAIDDNPWISTIHLTLDGERSQRGSDHIWLIYRCRGDSLLKISSDRKQVTFSFQGSASDRVVIKSCGAAATFPFEQEAKPMGGCEITELD